MSVSTILLSEFADPRFRAAFQSYFAELGIAVKDWDGLFREMDGEKINRAGRGRRRRWIPPVSADRR